MQLLIHIIAIRSAVIRANLFAESSPSGGRCGGNNKKIRGHTTGTSSKGKQHEFVFLEYQRRRRVIAAEERKLLHTRGRRGSSRYTNRALSVQPDTCHGDEDRMYVDRD